MSYSEHAGSSVKPGLKIALETMYFVPNASFFLRYLTCYFNYFFDQNFCIHTHFLSNYHLRHYRLWRHRHKSGLRLEVRHGAFPIHTLCKGAQKSSVIQMKKYFYAILKLININIKICEQNTNILNTDKIINSAVLSHVET